MNIQRGFRDKLEKYADPQRELTVEMLVNGQAVYDYCCFGVDAAGKLSDDRYMVFYNQVQSPNGEIRYTDNGGQARFTMQLAQLPATIQKLVFTVSIDGSGTMGQITSHTLRILQNQQPVAEMSLTGQDFHEEKAIISMEVYRKDVWRFAAVASGFNGGLGDLLRAYGGEEGDDDASSAPTPSPSPAANNYTPQASAVQPNSSTSPAYPPLVSQANDRAAQAVSPTPSPQGSINYTPQMTGTTQSHAPSSSSQDDDVGYTPSSNTYQLPSASSGNLPNGTYAPPVSYSIPSAQTSVPQGYAPPPTYPLPSTQGNVPQSYAPPPTYSVPSPQGSTPQITSSPQGYVTPSAQNNPASQGYTPPSAWNGAVTQNSYTATASPNGYTPAAGGTDAYGMPLTQASQASTISSPSPKKVSLEKKLQKDAPQLVSLAKPLQLALEKRNLQNCTARVALVLDMSGSMTRRYANGTVQDIVNKTLPLAVQFDDDGELDFWFYGNNPKRMPSVNMQNYINAVPTNWREVMHSIGATNNEPPVMKEVVSEYKKSSLPAYVLFITDGGVSNESKIKKILGEASRYPIFWQFVGVGGSNYGILERLDTMDGRYVDNAGFFALDDFKSVQSDELYDRLLNEFPAWLDAVKRNGMIQ